MALIVLDKYQMGVNAAPEGVSLMLAEIEGLPEGLALVIVMTPESAKAVRDRLDTLVPKTVAVADVPAMRREAARAGTPKPAA